MRSALAWLGLALMGLSICWLELLPHAERRLTSDRERARGPVALVIIDAGHGGQDSGTMRNGISEKDLTLDLAKRLERATRDRGFVTFMTRNGDEFVSLADRAAMANRERDCVFVSIHIDEGARAAATGVQTFYAAQQAPPQSTLVSWLPFLQKTSDGGANNLESQNLAGFVQESLVAGTQAFDRGTHAEQFFVVAKVRHPAVLVEAGFLTNNDDLAKLTHEEYRQRLAVAVAEGLARYRETVRQRQTALALGRSSSE